MSSVIRQRWFWITSVTGRRGPNAQRPVLGLMGTRLLVVEHREGLPSIIDAKASSSAVFVFWHLNCSPTSPPTCCVPQRSLLLVVPDNTFNPCRMISTREFKKPITCWRHFKLPSPLIDGTLYRRSGRSLLGSRLVWASFHTGLLLIFLSFFSCL